MIKTTLPHNGYFIENIFQHVEQRNFVQAEQTILSLIQGIVEEGASLPEYLQENIVMVHTLYFNFNEAYLAWIRSKNGDIQKEIAELYSSEHRNYLIAQSNDIGDMDDMFYVLIQYLENPTEDYRQEVKYYLDYYKKHLGEQNWNQQRVMSI